VIISHNLAALHAFHRLRINNRSAANNLEKLSSGFRINKAADDAAGLAISEKMRAHIRGLAQATRNIQDGISLVQTAEGALGTIHDILQRMSELAVQSANGTYSDSDRQRIQEEVEELKQEIDNIATNTEFNGIKLLDGSVAGKIKITAPYIGVWVFGQNPTHGQRWGVGSYPNSAPFEFVSPASSSVWIPTEIKGSIHETLLEMKRNFDKLKHNEITYGTANTLIQNHEMDMHVYGNTVIITARSDFTLTGDTYLQDAEYLTGSPATYEVTAAESTIQIQAGPQAGQTISIGIHDVQTTALQIADISLATQTTAEDAVRKIAQAIDYVSTERSKLGAWQNRLENALHNAAIYAENLTAAESRIRDADMAKQLMEWTKQTMFIHVSQAMLAQANQIPNQILALLK